MDRILIIIAALVYPHVTSAKDPSLMFDGGIDSIIAYKDNFYIDVSDQVTDGCLPRPSRLLDKMETSLRKSGFSISRVESPFVPTVQITALGYSIDDDFCAVHLKVTLHFLNPTSVPRSRGTSYGRLTLAELNTNIGSSLFTYSKRQMQSRLESRIEELADDLYLMISRAKDALETDFPEFKSPNLVTFEERM